MSREWPFDVGVTTSFCDPRDHESGEVHALGDLAALVADVVSDQGDLSEAVDTFMTEVAIALAGVYPHKHPIGDVTHLLNRLRAECVREGARVGYALALTAAAASEGLPAWGAAALAHRHRAGCTPDGHTESLARACRDLQERLEHARGATGRTRKEAPPA